MQRRFDTAACKQILERAGVGFRTGSVSFILACNICGKNKLYIRKKDGKSVCFHCQDQVKGWADRILAPIVEVPQSELAEVLYGARVAQGTGFLDLDIFDHFHDEEFGYEDEEFEIEAPLPEVYWPIGAYPLEHSAAEPGVAYLERRGVSAILAMKHDVRYIPQERRVCFPVALDGKMVGYQGRWIGDSVDEFGTPLAIPKMTTVGKIGGKALMFEENLKGSDYVILAEGPIDALKCCLMSGWVATMGKGVTPKQLELALKHKPSRLYLALDPDAASDVMRLLKELTGHQIEVYKIDPMPGYKDLGEMSAEDVASAFDMAYRVQAGNLFVYFN